MSIASEISRIQTAKADIKAAIESKGVTVPSDAKIDAYAPLIQAIGGGGSVIKFVEIDLTDESTSSSSPYVIDVTDDDVIYCLVEYYDERQYFRFNIKGILSEVSSVRDKYVLCWRRKGSSTIMNCPVSGYL